MKIRFYFLNSVSNTFLILFPIAPNECPDITLSKTCFHIGKGGIASCYEEHSKFAALRHSVSYKFKEAGERPGTPTSVLMRQAGLFSLSFSCCCVNFIVAGECFFTGGTVSLDFTGACSEMKALAGYAQMLISSLQEIKSSL